MKKLVFLLILSALTITAFGQTSLIPFQARLTDAGNTAVPDNVYNITFKVYDAATGGAPDWSENHINVSVIGGQINVLLGSLEPLTFNFITPKYLGITIGSGPEMVPRHQLVPSFHAQSASLAHEAEKLGGKTPDWYASKEHVAQEIADATADLNVTLTSTIATVDQHTLQIQDMSSDVNSNQTSVVDYNERLNYLESRVNSLSPPLYKITNSYCFGTAGFTQSATCLTRKIDQGCLYYNCDGTWNGSSCTATQPQECDNTFLGYVLHPE